MNICSPGSFVSVVRKCNGYIHVCVSECTVCAQRRGGGVDSRAGYIYSIYVVVE